MYRILIVNTVKTDPNGIAQVIFNINEHIDHSNLVMDLLSINEPAPKYYDRIEKYGGKIFVLQRNFKKLFYYIINLTKIIKRGNYNIVHAHGNSSTLLFEMLAVYLAGCKIRIAHSHNTTCNAIWIHNILWPLFNLLVTDRFACGKGAGKWLYKKNDFIVINNGIDTDKYAYNEQKRKLIRKQLLISDKTKLLGHVGFFNAQKNQKYLLDIFKCILEKDENVKLILIGDGPDRKMIEGHIEKLGIRNSVILTGLVNNVSDFLSAIDCIIMPSLYEGLPLSLIEEQASGLVCLVSDSITKEVNKSGNVQFVSLSNPPSIWSEFILKALRNLPERKKTSELAITAIENCGYSIHKEVKKLYGYYNEKLDLV